MRIAGALSDRDYPREAAAVNAGGTVAVSFRVRADGGVDSCRVLGSSGYAQLDGLTCALVERRFRYRPARNMAGEPIATTLRTTFTWGTRRSY
jgi:protein TonB